MVSETILSELSITAPTELKELLATASLVITGMAAELYANDAATRSVAYLTTSDSGLKTICHVEGRMGAAKPVIENERMGLYGYSKGYYQRRMSWDIHLHSNEMRIVRSTNNL